MSGEAVVKISHRKPHIRADASRQGAHTSILQLRKKRVENITHPGQLVSSTHPHHAHLTCSHSQSGPLIPPFSWCACVPLAIPPWPTPIRSGSDPSQSRALAGLARCFFFRRPDPRGPVVPRGRAEEGGCRSVFHGMPRDGPPGPTGWEGG